MAAVKPLSLTANSVINIAAYAAAIVITFFISPIIIRSLGDARYGVWSLIAEMTGYSSLLDIGLRGAVTYYVAFHSSRKDENELRSVIASAFWTLLALGVLVAAVGIPFSLIFPHIFNIESPDQAEASISFLILTVTIALTLPGSLSHAILVGLRRQAYATLPDISIRIISAITIGVSLGYGFGLVGLSIIVFMTRFSTWTIQAMLVYRCCPELTLAVTSMRWSAVQRLWMYGSKNFIINISQLMITRLDVVVVGLFLGVEAVTYYTIGATLVVVFAQGVASITQSYTPYFSHDSGAGRLDELQVRFLHGVRTSSLFSLILAAGLFMYGNTFISLWIGPNYVTGAWTARSDYVLYILLSAQLLKSLQHISWQLLLGTRQVRVLMWMCVTEAAFNLILSLVLVRWLGMVGVALGTFVPAALLYIGFLPWYMMRQYRLKSFDLLLAAPRPGYCAGLSVALSSWLLLSLHRPHNWAEFFGSCCLVGGIALVVTWRFGMANVERAAMIDGLRHIGSKSQFSNSRFRSPDGM